MVGATEGFGSGGFLVAVGNGGGSSTSTVFVGDGFALLEFWFVLSLALMFAPPSIGVSPGEGEAERFAF